MSGDKMTVTAMDREAAADVVKSYRDQKNGDWQQRIRDGLCDEGEMVQAFARHRTNTTTELVEALQKIADGEYDMPAETFYFPDKRVSKHNRCAHGQWMYDGCDQCCADFARKALTLHDRALGK